jgi:DNA polymerase/3'-5' exonuclease PolX
MKQTKLFGETNEPKIIAKLELAKAKTLASQIERLVKPFCNKIELVGSIRRQKPIVGDIDFVVVASDSNWNRIGACFKKSNTICSGTQLIKINFPCEGDLFQADFYRAYNNNFGIQQLIRTGSADHNMWLAGYAISKGYRLKYSEGLLENDRVIVGDTEENVFCALGLICPKPEEREIVEGKPVWLKTPAPVP